LVNKTVFSKDISPFRYGRHISFPAYPIGQSAVAKSVRQVDSETRLFI